MQIACKRHTELPHTSKLFGDFLYHYDRVAEFYPHPPFHADSFEASAKSILYPADRRAKLVEVLRAQNGDHDALRELGKADTVAVVTGQQVGLFSGPAYTIYKALTAVRLARRLTEQGLNAVPVFWLATEDHDLAEVSYAWTFNSAQELVALRVNHGGLTDAPVGGISIAAPPLQELHSSLAGLPFGEEVEALVRQAYVPGRAFGPAFSDLLRSLLGEYGMLFFDPMHPAARQLAAPFLAQAVEAAPDLIEQLLQRNSKLAESGYHAQVHIERSTSLFFLIEDGHRLALRRKNGEYTTKDRRLSAEELKARAAQLSPNALLRPVVQDYMFPTVAYIGGPAELAYLAQSQVIYQTLLGRMPVAVPRNGFTLIDTRGKKLMERYALDLDGFFGGEEHLRELIAARLIPPEINDLFTGVAEQTGANLKKLRGAVDRFDPTLAAGLDRGAAKIQYQLSKMQRKVARETMRRSERAKEESRYLYDLLYPHKHLQERFYSILPFLARHGMDLVDRIYDAVHVDCPDHHLLYV
ncbi:MAG TPA: bacillithiol biosynthesis cysteine-adding enzyme BshC [Bryobacteraceae bacterium]|nr:bacillithiol biosynthesis cysteine-adding enzyme BshC [Bryobacteraceae bacterium]